MLCTSIPPTEASVGCVGAMRAHVSIALETREDVLANLDVICLLCICPRGVKLVNLARGVAAVVQIVGLQVGVQYYTVSGDPVG